MGGCAPYPLFGSDPKVATGTIEVPVTEALVLPEPGAAPRVIAVLETQYLNALEQEIVLATNSAARGENSIHVIFFGPVKGRTGRENIRADDFLSEEALETEMLERMPGVSMQTSNYFVQNRYGPFNYAMGYGGSGEMCMYAWQRIQSQVPLYTFWRDRGVLSVRMRLCQAGASEQDLLRVMYRYSINGYFLPRSWQPYGRPMGEPVGIGQIGGPLAYPSGLQGDGTVMDGWLGAEPAPPPSAAAPRARSPRRYGTPVAQPEQIYADPQAGYGAPGYTEPVEGYPSVPGPATSNQMAPSTTPRVIQGQPQPGAVVDPAPSRPVRSNSETTPFSTPPQVPGLAPQPRTIPAVPGQGSSNTKPGTSSTASVGAPVRLVPGASNYPVAAY